MFKTADLCDEFGQDLYVNSIPFLSYGGKKQFSGRIATVRVLEDNVLVKEAINTVPAGSVIVVDGAASHRCALLGDRLASLAVSRGITGIIIYGCVRDTAELAKMDLGILALGSTPLKSRKEGKGERDVVLRFGDIPWIPGHYVYADGDGVIVSPKALL